jgi:hypothetical protein
MVMMQQTAEDADAFDFAVGGGVHSDNPGIGTFPSP